MGKDASDKAKKLLEEENQHQNSFMEIEFQNESRGTIKYQGQIENGMANGLGHC